MQRSRTISTALIALTASSSAWAQLAPRPEAIARQPDEQPKPHEPTSPEAISEWINHLDADDWLTRDLATIELAELEPGISLEQLEIHITRPDLSDEQRARLHLACLRRFALRTKGALGVSFGTIRVGAIEVQPIPENPNFPASMILKENDRVAMVDNHVIDGSFILRAEILSRNPGDILPATIIRNDQVMHVELPLGSYEDLTGAARMDPQLLTTALRLRWERMRLIEPQTKSVGDAITIEDWSAAAFPQDTEPNAKKDTYRSPRGWLIGPDLPIDTRSTAWGRASIDVWSNPQALLDATTKRAELINAEQIQPLIALRLLIERERTQIQSKLKELQPPNQDREAHEELIIQLNVLTDRLDIITQEIEAARKTAPQP